MFVHVRIKGRQGEPSEFYGIAVLVFPDDNVGAGFLVFQFNFIPDKLDIFPVRRIGRIRRDHEQTHMRAFLTTDHLDNFVQPHLANIDVIGRPLRNGADSVTYLKPSIDLGRPARNEAFDFRIAVF